MPAVAPDVFPTAAAFGSDPAGAERWGRLGGRLGPPESGQRLAEGSRAGGTVQLGDPHGTPGTHLLGREIAPGDRHTPGAPGRPQHRSWLQDGPAWGGVPCHHHSELPALKVTPSSEGTIVAMQRGRQEHAAPSLPDVTTFLACCPRIAGTDDGRDDPRGRPAPQGAPMCRPQGSRHHGHPSSAP